MNDILKYLGVIVVLIGAGVLAATAFMGTTNNTSLTIGGVLLVLGLILQIVIPKFVVKE